MKAAEKKCGKVGYPGVFNFSPELKSSALQLIDIRRLLRRCKTDSNYKKFLESEEKKYELELKVQQIAADETRDVFIEDLALKKQVKVIYPMNELCIKSWK